MSRFDQSLPPVCVSTRAWVFETLDRSTSIVQPDLAVHLTSCDSCTRYQAETGRILEALGRSTATVTVPPGLTADILARLKDFKPADITEKKWIFLPTTGTLLRYNAVAFSVLALLVFAGFAVLLIHEPTAIRDAYNQGAETAGSLGYRPTPGEESFIALVDDTMGIPAITHDNLSPLLHSDVMQPFELDLLQLDILLAHGHFNRTMSYLYRHPVIAMQTTSVPGDN